MRQWHPALSITFPHYLHHQVRWQRDGREMTLGQGKSLPVWSLIAYEYTSYVRGSLPLEPSEVKKNKNHRYYYINFCHYRNSAEFRKQLKRREILLFIPDMGNSLISAAARGLG